MKKILASTLALIAGLALAMPAHAVPTVIAPVSPAAILSGSPSANALDVTLTALDASNGNKTLSNGQLLLIFYNSHATNAYTFTVTSQADRLGRTGHITTYSLAAGEYAVVGPFPTEGFTDSSGYINYTGENAAVKVLPLQLRGSLNYR